MTSPPDPAPTGTPLFEAVPNLSCARDTGLLDALDARMREAGVDVIDRSADIDHRRSVWTWLGEAGALQRAALSCLELLRSRRRLHDHRGAHPRTGLFDVFPWVPLAELLHAGSGTLGTWPAVRDSTMGRAHEAAHDAGRSLAAAAEIPVYFYEHAASCAGRRDLARHRRMLLRSGALDASDPPQHRLPDHWRPDHGPRRPHPELGVLMVSARRPLIAFNLDLESDDVHAARAIASAIRQRSPGGLPGVKALGLFLPERGCAQVSVNLVDARRTDLPELVARVRFEAAQRGQRVRRAERIGLLTEVAVAGASAADLALEALRPEHLIETHLRRRLERESRAGEPPRVG